MYRLFRKSIQPVESATTDVLIFDNAGDNWLHHCLPTDIKSVAISMRHSLPVVLNFRFFFHLLKSLIREMRGRDGDGSYSLLCALINDLSPRVIISCIDNSRLLSRFATDHPQTKVVFIQTALRDSVLSFLPKQHLPVYLSLGETERKIFHTLDIQCKEYRPIGSVKLGLALAKRKDRSDPEYDLAFISHYRSDLFGDEAPQLHQLIEANQRNLFRLCCRYAENLGLTIVVIMRARTLKVRSAETKYYKNLAGELPVHFVYTDKTKKELDSYFAGLASGLVIHSASTLGFELLAAEKRVIAGATADPTLIGEWGIEHYVNSLPDSIKLKAGSSDTDFFKQCDMIRAMPDAQYRETIHKATQSLITIAGNKYPHEKVKTLISDWLRL